jgi:two-component system LytT family sensor kinase
MWKTALRISLVSVYAFTVLLMIRFTRPDNIEINIEAPKYLLLVLYFVFFNLNTEGSLYFDRYLNKKLPWYFAPKKRLYLQTGFVLLWSLITIGLPFTFWYFHNGGSFIYPPTSVIIFLGSFIFLSGFIGISMTINFFRQGKQSILEIEKLKREKLKSDYRVLQNQVNPHFLFNSLNVLISEIKHNPDTAVEFTRKLSKVYRYVLQSKNYDLTNLKQELDFIESYIFLHKVRIGESLKYSVSIDDEAMHMQIPPLTLQIVVENAIKHNIANEENTLYINISSQDSTMLIVKIISIQKMI